MGKLPNFNYEVIEDLGVLSETPYQSKRLRIVSYNGHEPKFDIRQWVRDREDPSREILGKGICLNSEEMLFLRDLIDGLDLDSPIPDNKGFVTGGFDPKGFDTSGVFG